MQESSKENLDIENGEKEYRLGEKYLFEKNYEKAYNIFMELANKNVSYSYNAKYRLGLLYHYGYWVEKNDEVALKYLLESGHPDAMKYAGIIYYNQKRYKKAFEYLSMVEEKDGYAFLLISKMYAYGYYVRRDLERAKYRLTKLLEQNENDQEIIHVLEMIRYFEDGTFPHSGIYY